VPRICAIHQPNFFPWLGYFNKIARSDVFVVLDDAQHQKTGSNWTTRVKLLLAGQPQWVGGPVCRPAHGTIRIDQLQWDDSQPWREKMMRSIALNYRRCAHFTETVTLIEPLVMNPQPTVAAYNLYAIGILMQALGIATPLVLASGFAVAESSNARLALLATHVGADTYLAGGGAQAYQDDAVLAAHGLAVRSQGFQSRAYPQRGLESFVAGLSVIDVLMQVGIAGARSLLVSEEAAQ
jgi:hypothetical protein